MTIRIVPLGAHHRPDWEALYAGYAAFYRVTQTPAMRERVWGWIMDPAHEVKAFVAEDTPGHAIGLAHYRPFARRSPRRPGAFSTISSSHQAIAARGSPTRSTTPTPRTSSTAT